MNHFLFSPFFVEGHLGQGEDIGDILGSGQDSNCQLRDEGGTVGLTRRQ